MGIKDPKNVRASYLTPFAKHRAARDAADDATTFDAITAIDLSAAHSADGNTVRVIPRRTSGAGTVTIELWRALAGASDALKDVWIRVSNPIAIGDDEQITEAVFPGLLAAKYRVKISAIGAGVWDLYESHSES